MKDKEDKEESLWEEEQFPSPRFGPLTMSHDLEPKIEEGSDIEKLLVFSSFALAPPKFISETLYVPPMPMVPRHERVVHVHDDDDDDDYSSELDTSRDLKKSHSNWDSEGSLDVDNSFKDWNDFSLHRGGSSSSESVVSRESSDLDHDHSIHSISRSDYDSEEEGNGEGMFAFLRDESDYTKQYIQETLALAAIHEKEEDAKRQQCKQTMMEVERLILPLQPLSSIKECPSVGWDTDDGSNNHDSGNSIFSLVSLVERSQHPLQTTITEAPLSPQVINNNDANTEEEYIKMNATTIRTTTPRQMSAIEELSEKVIQQKERARLLKERSYVILAKAARRREGRRQNVLEDLEELNRSSEEQRRHNIASRKNSSPQERSRESSSSRPRLTPPTKLIEKTPASELRPQNMWGRSA
mmetsp:Transcript_7717/g.13904  ORF Transcript_7717/g.13904 Transcript_7717/m.13904 type:complete len:412 (-) Transcript_7717:182-1417(-)